MGRHRYDYRWKEVRDINSYAILVAYVFFVIRGLGFLVVTWTTVVLLGGFVSMIDKNDFWRLMVITLIQTLWTSVSFAQRIGSFDGLFSSLKTVKNVLTRKWQLADKAHRGHPNLTVVKRVIALIIVVVRWVLALTHNVLLVFCMIFMFCLYLFGLPITTSLSIYGLVKNANHGDTDDGRTNMYPAYSVLYILCLAQGALFLYSIVMIRWEKRILNQVSQAYGFQDGDPTVSDYCDEIIAGCMKDPSSARERNLITYAIELMESKSTSSYLSGTLLLDRLLTRQPSGQIKAPTLIEQVEEKKQRWQQQQKQLHLEEKAVAQLIKKEKEMKAVRTKSMEKRKKKRQERKKRQQREEAIIAQQRTTIKRLIGSASSTNVVQKLLQTLDSRRSYDKKMREAAARIVDHVAGRIHLEQFPRGINCISSLINNFEEYRRLQPDESSSSPSNTDEAPMMSVPPSSHTNKNNGDDRQQESNSNYSSSESESESEAESEPASEYSESEPELESYNGINRPSSSKPLNGYKDLVLTGLSILWSLAGNDDNCRIINNTKHLVSKIIAPISYDLVHRTHHSAWSTSVVDASMRVMLRLMETTKDTKGDTGADLCQQISNNEAITTMVKIVTCEECKGKELQMTALQILMQLRKSGFTKILIDFFIKGDRDVSVRKIAGKELVLLFLDSKDVAALPCNEEKEEFVDSLAEIVSHVGNEAECRKSAAEILEHMCIHYTKNSEYLRNAMAGAMPKVLREILRIPWLTGEGQPEYPRLGTDIESQDTTNGRTNNNKNRDNTSSSPEHQHPKLYVALLSLYVTACEKLHLDIDAISPGDGIAFRFAMQMVQSNWDCVSVDSLTVIKLSTRIVIATMKKLRGTDRHVVKPADLESLMDTLTRISETMLDLEGSMVFSVGMTATMIPATADTLDFLVKQARQLHTYLKTQGSGINFS